MKDLSLVSRSKLPGVGTTIFTVMTNLAKEHGAINLSQGFPEMDVAPDLKELVAKYMNEGHNQYAHMAGSLRLREVLSKKIKASYNIAIDPEKELNITSGATQAIYTAITATIREGDEVLVFTPAYDCYAPAIELNGGVPIYVQLKAPNYAIDWEDVKKLMNGRTRMIVLNSPHNPTGKVLSADDMKQLQKLVEGSDIIILSDEVYEHIVFDGLEHQSVLRYPKLAERSFAIFSFGKTYNATGWKMGYVVAPPGLMIEFRKVHQYLVFSSNHPVQLALADYMEQAPEAYLSLSNMFQKKRDLFLEGVKDSRFKAVPAEGGYFQLLGYKTISKEHDVEMAERITREFGVASIPISVFYNREVNDHMLRFCFAKSDETLLKATEILCKI